MSFDGKRAQAPAEFVAPPEQDLGFGIIRTMRKQKAWYFQRTGTDEYGKDQYCPPTLILCRWDDCIDYNIMQMARMEDISATVYVDRKCLVGDVLMQAEDDAKSTDTPPEIDTSSQIKEFKVIPNIRNTARLYVAML